MPAGPCFEQEPTQCCFLTSRGECVIAEVGAGVITAGRGAGLTWVEKPDLLCTKPQH